MNSSTTVKRFRREPRDHSRSDYAKVLTVYMRQARQRKARQGRA